MRVLVVGGSGFVGSHVADAFLRAGHDVRSLSRRAPRFGEIAGIRYTMGHACDAGDLAKCLHRCDAVVFALTTTTPGSAHSDPEGDLTSNVLSGIRVLRAAGNANVKHVVLLSSAGTVYGIPRELPIAESHPTDPISAYGASRLALEKYFGVFCYQTNTATTILRISNAIGERQVADSGQGAAAVFLASVTRGEVVQIWGDGSVVRDYIYAGDVAEACLRAVEAPNGRRRGALLVVNVGSGIGTKLLDLLTMCVGVVGRGADITWMPAREFDVPAVVLDIRRAEEVLGWRPKTSLQAGLEHAARTLASDTAVVMARAAQ